jgi:hypothetical protein
MPLYADSDINFYANKEPVTRVIIRQHATSLTAKVLPLKKSSAQLLRPARMDWRAQLRNETTPAIGSHFQ